MELYFARVASPIALSLLPGCGFSTVLAFECLTSIFTHCVWLGAVVLAAAFGGGERVEMAPFYKPT